MPKDFRLGRVAEEPPGWGFALEFLDQVLCEEMGSQAADEHPREQRHADAFPGRPSVLMSIR